MANEPPDDKSLRDAMQKFTGKTEADKTAEFMAKNPQLNKAEEASLGQLSSPITPNAKKSDDGSPAQVRTPYGQPTKSR